MAWLRARLLASILLVAASWPASAQTNTGEVDGVVRDTVGGVLPGVGVTARHRDAGLVVARVTDAEGRFFLPALRIGTWEIKAELSGFASRTDTIVLEIGRTLSLEITLGL